MPVFGVMPLREILRRRSSGGGWWAEASSRRPWRSAMQGSFFLPSLSISSLHEPSDLGVALVELGLLVLSLDLGVMVAEDGEGWPNRSGGGSLFPSSHRCPSDHKLQGPAAACFFGQLNNCCWFSSEEDALVGSCGETCTSLRYSSTSAQWAVSFLQGSGAGLEMTNSLLNTVVLLSLSSMKLMHTNLELSMVLQGSLHMRDGIWFLDPRCSALFKAAVRGMCWVGEGHMLNFKLEAVMWIMLYASNQASGSTTRSKFISKYSSYELRCYVSGCCALNPLQAEVHDEDAFLLFGTCRRQVRASLLRFLRFNGKEPPVLSSVMDHLDLQLNPLPHRHLLTRLLVEPLALQLARLQEGMEEYDCRYVVSEFSTDPLQAPIVLFGINIMFLR
ncbi:unnamed protein product [Alopecurus aequalis]